MPSLPWQRFAQGEVLQKNSGFVAMAADKYISLSNFWGCLKLVTISCYNVTTLQHLFVVTNTVTTFISCNSIISTHNCYIQIFVVISKYLLLQRQRKVVTQIFVVTMSGICWQLTVPSLSSSSLDSLVTLAVNIRVRRQLSGWGGVGTPKILVS